MTHILVIGKSGQVARALSATPLPEGWRLTPLGRSQLDLTQPSRFEAILAAYEPDIIINAAAYTAVDRAEAEEDLAALINGLAPGELAAVSARRGIPFLHISTDYVFEGRCSKSWSEEDAPCPVNAYGRSKLFGERAIDASGARSTIVRTSWVFSPWGTNFVKTMLQLVRDHQEISVVSDQIGGPTYASDIARTLIAIAQAHSEEQAEDQSGIFHYCGQPATNRADFADNIFRFAQWIEARPAVHRVATTAFKTDAVRPLNTVLDCSKIGKVFGIRQPDWREGLKQTLEAVTAGQD